MKNPDIFITLFKWGIRISIVAVVIIIGLGFILNYSITDGSLPSENKAIELKEEIISFLDNSKISDDNIEDLPQSVRDLNPIHVSRCESGIRITFKTRFVEDYGYYYKLEGKELADWDKPFCREISENVYKYYNPG